MIEIRAPEASEIASVVRVWHETKRAAYDFIPLEQGRTLDEDDAFFRREILPRSSLWIAVEDGRVLGFLALRGSYVDRLYVHPGQQRRGVGEALLQKALALSPQGLELHTHVRNAKARAFYEKHGFRAARFGTSPPPESEPDVEYQLRT